MTAHKVSTLENRCGEINTSSDILSPLRLRHFSALVKYCGVVLRKRSLAPGSGKMKSFVKQQKTSEGINEDSSLENKTKGHEGSVLGFSGKESKQGWIDK